MATVNSTSSTNPYAAINAANTAQSTNASGSTSAADIQNRFLTLLVTQLKNQDPLNPMDNAQVTTQLSQINTVNGIEKLNTTLTQMLGVYNDGQAMQAAGMIGKNVLVAGANLDLLSGKAYGGISLPSAADNVSVSVLDAAGNVVQTESLGSRKAGNFGFVWDGATAAGGTAADGAYTFKVTATQGDKTVSATALQLGTVSAVTRTASGFQLDLGKLGTVDFKNVQEIL